MECFRKKSRKEKAMHKYVLNLCLCTALLLTGCNGAQRELAMNPLSIEAASSVTSNVAQQKAKAVNTNSAENKNPSNSIMISFDFNRGRTAASNQFAVWIEDDAGKLVKTLAATNFTAKGGYKIRKDSIPTWVAKANPAAMTVGEVEAVSRATPQAGKIAYTWDGTDMTGKKWRMELTTSIWKERSIGVVAFYIQAVSHLAQRVKMLLK